MSVIEKQSLKYKPKQSSKKVQFLLSIFLPIIVFISVVTIFGIHYRTNDDATLANIAAGAYGTNLRMIYINVVFSAIMRPFYLLFSANWYVILQIILMLISISILFHLFMEKLGVQKGALIGLCLLIPFATYLFYSFQYTKTGSVIIATGLILIIDNLGKKNKFTWFGIVLCWLGCMLRWENFFALGGLSAFLLLSKFLKLDKSSKKQAILTMVIFFIAILGTKAIDVMAYRINPDWDFYVKYNKARTQFSDYKVYFLNEVNSFSHLNVSDAEYKVLNDWDFYDGEVFTIDLLNQISNNVPNKSLKTALHDTLSRTPALFHGESYRYVFAIVIIIGILCASLNTSYLGFMGFLLTFALEFLYLIWRGRFTDWVEVGLLWAICVFGIYWLIDTKPKLLKNKLPIIFAFCFLCITCIPSIKQTYSQSIDHKTRKHIYEDELAKMSEDKQNLYIISVKNLDALAGYDILHPRKDNFFSNIVACGGWLSQSPHRNKVLASYNAQRPIVDGVDNPNVYFSAGNIENMAEYASDQLGCKVYIIKTGNISFAPYQLTTTLPK